MRELLQSIWSNTGFLGTMWFNIGLWLFSVLISSLSQMLLKISANKKYPSKIREYVNPYVVIAYGMFFLSTFMTMYAMRTVPYSFSPMIESAQYIFVPLLGVMVLREKISRRRLLGIVIILVGMGIFATASYYRI